MNTTTETIHTQAKLDTAAMTTNPTSFLEKHWQKLLALTLWLLVIGSYLWYSQANQLSPLGTVQALIELMLPWLKLFAQAIVGRIVLVGHVQWNAPHK